MIIIVIAAVLGAAIIFAAGYIVGSGGLGAADLTVTVDAGGTGTPCDLLCRKWKQRRAEACSAISASDRAAQAQAAANAALISAVAAAALLLAAAVAASLIPLFGSVFAASLFAAYATAQLYVIYLLGSAAGAANVAANAANGVTTALAEVTKAEAALKAGCSDATALAACLATPSPCPGVP